MIGKNNKRALVTLVERKSLYTVIDAVPRGAVAAVRAATVSGLATHMGSYTH